MDIWALLSPFSHDIASLSIVDHEVSTATRQRRTSSDYPSLYVMSCLPIAIVKFWCVVFDASWLFRQAGKKLFVRFNKFPQ